MALRYFNPIEPEYVPTYTSLDPQITSLTNQQIQRQVENFQTKRDKLDLATSNVVDSFTNLSDEAQMRAREETERSRKSIQDIVETRGARDAMPYLDSESRRLTEALRPYQTVSKKKAAAAEMLKESEAATGIKNFALRNGPDLTFNEEGQAEIQGNYNQNYLDVVANWERFSDFLDKNAKGRQEIGTETTFSESPIPSEYIGTEGDTIDYRTSLSGVRYSDAHIQNMMALTRDPKMREQLELYGDYMMETNSSDIRILKNGNIERDFYVPVEKEKGSGIYVTPDGEETRNPAEAKPAKVSREFGSKADMAASYIAEPQSLKNSGLKLKYITNKNNVPKRTLGDNESSFNGDILFSTTNSMMIGEKDSAEWVSGIHNEVQSIDKRHKELRNTVVDNAFRFFNLNEEQGEYVEYNPIDKDTPIAEIVITRPEEEGTPAYQTTYKGVGEIEKYYNDKIESISKNDPYSSDISVLEVQRDQMIQAMDSSTEMIRRKKRQKNRVKEINDRIYSILGDPDNEYKYNENIVSALQLNDDGTIDLKDVELKEVEGDFSRMDPDDFDFFGGREDAYGVDLNDITRGGFKVIRAIPTDWLGGKTPQDYIVTRDENDNLLYAKKSETTLGKALDDAKKVQQELVDDVRDAGEHKEYLTEAITPGVKEHDQIVGTLENLAKGMTAQNSGFAIRTSDGKELETEELENIEKGTINVKSIGLKDGVPVAIASFINEDTNATYENLANVELSGSAIQDMVEAAYGSTYHLTMGVASIKEQLPEMLSEEGSTTELNPRQQRSVLGGYDLGKNLKITHITRRRNGQETSEFKVKLGDNYLGNFSTATEMQRMLINYIVKQAQRDQAKESQSRR